MIELYDAELAGLRDPGSTPSEGSTSDEMEALVERGVLQRTDESYELHPDVMVAMRVIVTAGATVQLRVLGDVDLEVDYFLSRAGAVEDVRHGELHQIELFAPDALRGRLEGQLGGAGEVSEGRTVVAGVAAFEAAEAALRAGDRAGAVRQLSADSAGFINALDNGRVGFISSMVTTEDEEVGESVIWVSDDRSMWMIDVDEEQMVTARPVAPKNVIDALAQESG